MEIPFVMYLYFFFNGILKNRKLKPLIAAIPIFLLYIAHDLYFFTFGTVPRLIEIKHIPQLIETLNFRYNLVIIPFFVLFAILIINIDPRQYRVLLWRSTPVIALLILLVLTPSKVSRFIKQNGEIYSWSDLKSVRKTGRLIFAIYNEAERIRLKRELASYRDPAVFYPLLSQLKSHVSKRHNIHIIVLESFIDPRRFQNITFNRPPAHRSFDQIFDHLIGSSHSPSFGTLTSEAEFEILCGVPGFMKFGMAEFDFFTGSETYCLPQVLNQLGYITIATNGHKPYYNAIKAYKGLGFQEIFFPKEYVPNNNTYLLMDDVTKGVLFDGSLLQQNLSYITKKLKHSNRPIFNYVIGMYGHFPFNRNESRRPTIINTDPPIPEIQKIANQFYYRTKAIADFITNIKTIDPDCLIIIVGDHLPPLGVSSKDTYKKLGYLNNQLDSLYLVPLLVVENGKVKKFNHIRHYHLYNVILNYITGGYYCKRNDCYPNPKGPEGELLLKKYLTIMSFASG